MPSARSEPHRKWFRIHCVRPLGSAISLSKIACTCERSRSVSLIYTGKSYPNLHGRPRAALRVQSRSRQSAAMSHSARGKRASRTPDSRAHFLEDRAKLVSQQVPIIRRHHAIVANEHELIANVWTEVMPTELFDQRPELNHPARIVRFRLALVAQVATIPAAPH